MVKKIISLCCSLFCLTSFCVNPVVLEQIIKRYNETDSDALRIEVDGKVVLELGDEAPFETMSITKSVVNLAIGILIDQGKIPSLDTPVHTYFPEWNVEKKRDITLRHILTHTTGLKSFSSFEEAYIVPDFVQSALDADFMHDVGGGFFYNNRVVNILSGIVEKASGKRLDIFVEETLFAPLGILNYYWNLDFEGHAIGMSGLELSAKSLSAIGTLILNRGKWDGKQIVSEQWLDQSFQSSQSYNMSCGLLWWIDREEKGSWPEALLNHYEHAGISSAYIERLRALHGSSVVVTDAAMIELFGSKEGYQGFLEEVKRSGLETCVLESGEIKGYQAHGYLGQYLIIIPKDNIVAVRQVQYGKKPDDQIDEFEDFTDLIHQLTLPMTKCRGDKEQIDESI